MQLRNCGDVLKENSICAAVAMLSYDQAHIIQIRRPDKGNL